MGIDSHLSTCVDTQSPKYLEMAQGHISLSPPLRGHVQDNTPDSLGCGWAMLTLNSFTWQPIIEDGKI
jgi:hypothetical protein